MKTIKLKINKELFLADTTTPVGLYLKMRDVFPNSFMLESSDYHGNKNKHSYICLDPLASIEVQNDQLTLRYGNESHKSIIKNRREVITVLNSFIHSFKTSDTIPVNGIFGYTSYDSIKYFETIKLDHKNKIPDLHYTCFRFIIQFDHFNNTLLLIENQPEMDTSKIEFVKTLINIKSYPHYKFSVSGKESFNIGEKDFKEMVSKSKEHCKRGDVFQIVLSRTFNKSFKGDEFNVYRALRAINPSPYLFYFDFGSFRIFGSSPEAQLKVTNGKAIINPIAGTFKRTGNDQEDYSSAEELLKDPKENAEHTMLVDLARNDLSRHCKNVKVASYKEIQFYSHVIHLVSEVEGELNDPGNPVLIFADTFPAGTLSGAPKYKAMELIDIYEKSGRGFYGGAIGYFGFNNEVNHAITIRSFLSMNNTLTYQAGAGIVADSQEENELQEVNNKLEALKKAIIMAEKV